MNKDDFDLLHQFKREHISNSSLDLFSGLADRCFGFVRKNVRSKESIELFAEEEFIRKKDFSEMVSQFVFVLKFIVQFSFFTWKKRY